MSTSSKKIRNVVTLSGGALVAASPFVASGSASAATLTVDSLADDGTGYTLREAIAEANSNTDATVIQFSPTLAGTITLTEPLRLLTSIVIQGPGASAITIDADGNGMVFYARDISEVADIAISGLTLIGGDETYFAGAISSFGDNLTLDGLVITGNTGNFAGGIYRDGNCDGDAATLTIRNTSISGNDGTTIAGGVYLRSGGDADTPALIIESSTVSGNTGGFGGGLYAGHSIGEIDITNSTFSGNTALYGGGAVYLHHALASDVLIRNTTITGNSAGGNGGGLYVGNSSVTSVTIENSVIAGNSAAVGVAADSDGNDIMSSNAAPIAIDYSLIGSTVGYTSAGANNLSGDPMLGALADNGGPTMTHMPQAGSPAIDAGDPAFSTPPVGDQRGLPRVWNGRVDMGSVEAGSVLLPPTGGSNSLMALIGAGLLALGGALHLTGRRTRRA